MNNKYGMELHRLSSEILCRIVEMYDATTGGRGRRNFRDCLDMDSVRDTLARSNGVDWRFGSSLSPNSKLFIYDIPFTNPRIIRFVFDPNIGGESNTQLHRDAQRLTLQFAEAVDFFLVEQGLAMKLQ